MIKTLITFFFSLPYVLLFSQQLNQISMPIFHPYLHHAAYGGFDRTINVTAVSRNQWNGIEGDPRMQYVGAHLPFYAWKGGAGVDLSNMSEGNFRVNFLRFSANKVIETEIGILSIGGRLGINNIRFGLNGVYTPNGVYTGSVTNHNDPLLTESFSGIGIGWEIGAWLRASKYQGGISIADTPSPFIDLSRGFSFDKNINIFLNTFYDFSETVQLQPFINVKSNLSQTQTEISGVVRYNGNIFGGIMLRGYNSSSIDAMGVMVGHRLNKRYSLYYTYDAGLSSLRKTNEGSHEIMMKMDFYTLPKSGIPPKTIYNPRYLE
jgi:type IX secretion system PorP/SprF family membrane protein